MQERLVQARSSLGLQVRTLEAVSPLATLHRGYAIVTRVEDGKVIEQSSQVNQGSQLRTKLAKGELICRVEEIFDAE
jgi:exodeoxyribonuclease VII large subunit